MRTLFGKGLASLAVLLAAILCSTSASAASFTLGETWQGTTQTSGSVTVPVTFDTGATTGITLMSVAVLFDDTILSYDQGSSSTTSYLLYGGKGGGGYLNAAGTCGGGYGGATAGDGCQQWIGATDPSGLAQVNLDFVSADLANGTQNTGNGILIATLVFDIVALGDGSAEIQLGMTSSNVIGQPGGGSTLPSSLGGGGVVFTPEPTTALLVGLGLAGLGYAGRKQN